MVIWSICEYTRTGPHLQGLGPAPIKMRPRGRSPAYQAKPNARSRKRGPRDSCSAASYAAGFVIVLGKRGNETRQALSGVHREAGEKNRQRKVSRALGSTRAAQDGQGGPTRCT